MLDLGRRVGVCDFSGFFVVFFVGVRVWFFIFLGDVFVFIGSSVDFRRFFLEFFVLGVAVFLVDSVWVVGSIWRFCILFRGIEVVVIFFWGFLFLGIV